MAVEVKAFPVGYPYINVVTASKFRITGQQSNFSTHSYICGQTISPFDLQMPLIDRSLIIHLKPWGLQSLYPNLVPDISNLQIDLALLDSVLANELAHLMDSSLSSESVLESAQKALITKFKGTSPDTRVLAAWQQIVWGGGDLKVAELASYLNLSPRRLQQLFKSVIGMSPKQYMKVARLQHYTYHLLQHETNDTIPSGYYDQSHFIHELGQQTQMTPTAFHSFLTTSGQSEAYLNTNLYRQYGSN